MIKEYVDMTLWLNPVSREDMPAIFDDVKTAVKIGNLSPTTGEPLALYFNDLSPQTPALNMRCRVNYSGGVAFKATDCRYCQLDYYVSNDDGNSVLRDTYYFWIESNRWIANQTLELNLKMDVLQTLEAVLEENGNTLDDIFDPRTMIARMHKDRFAAILDNKYLYARVDEVPEQLGTFTLLKRSDEIINDKRLTSFSETLQTTAWELLFAKCSVGTVEAQYTLFAPKEQTNYNIYAEGATSVNIPLGSLDFVDTQNSKITKCIELPYLPYVTQVTGSDTSETATLTFKYPLNAENKAIAYAVKGDYSTNNTNFFAGAQSLNLDKARLDESLPLIAKITIPENSQLVTSKNMARGLWDTKLLHSDFHDLRFVYDSFSWSFKYEQTKKYAPVPMGVNIYFVAPTSPVSRFGFLFEKEYCGYTDYGGDAVYDEDFAYLDCSRNNEVALYTDDYLNYLRNGYNYDVKSRAISVGSDVAGGLFKAGIAAAVGGPAGAGLSVASTLLQSISSFAQGDNSLNAKIAQLKARSVAVSGSDSLTALNAYSGNKLHLMTYTPNETITNMIDDLFYYYGYKVGTQGKPDTSSRHWFNFIQCNAKYSRDYWNRLPRYMLDELTRLFAYGVTRFHRDAEISNPVLVLGYDIDQKMENFETTYWNRLN